MVVGIIAAAVSGGYDLGSAVRCSRFQWKEAESSCFRGSYENRDLRKRHRAMRVRAILPLSTGGRSVSSMYEECRRYSQQLPSCTASYTQMLTLKIPNLVCNHPARDGRWGANAIRVSSTNFSSSKVDFRIADSAKECRRNPVGIGAGLRRKSNLRVCCAGGEGDGDKKEGGGGVGTTEKEPEPSPGENNNNNINNSPAASPSGSPELDVLPHAFRFVELIGPEKVDPEDVKILKESVFGYSTFWITGQEPFGDLGEGVLLLGNLRGKREEVFAKLQRRLREVMGTKYELFMVEEPNAEDEDPRGGPRVSFVLQREEVSDIGPTTLWQYIVAIVLFLLTGGTCLELGISSQVSRLPPEVVQYITNPETTVPPDLQVLVPYVDSALPLAYGVFGVQLLHELGHRLAAAPRNVKLGIPYFIPNITLGSFGSITQFRSVCPDRQTKFDISLAGPLAGGVLSCAMFGVGLILSTNPDASSQVVQVPSLLLQGSLLLGLASRGVLGYTALHATTVSIHPLVIAGWCGLTTTAFNLLPVGCLDGGRAMQAAFGRSALNISGIVTYILLGLGVLGGPLSLPWGLYILIAQRSPERPCLNDVSGVGSLRKALLTVSTLLVVATLLPVWDELAEELGIGIVNILQPLN